MKEIITLFIGQAGVQLGNSMWELLCAEHGINEYGQLMEQPLHSECTETFFGLSSAGTYVPRGLFIDLEPTVIDEIRNGSTKKLFHPNRLITGPEDAASNFARGFFTVGKLLLGTINSETRRLLENSDGIQGIFLLRSLGGGTGAGLTSAIFDGLAEYPKICKVEMPIYPSPTLSSSMVEPYNCLLGEHFCMEDVDVGLLIDNEAMYDICSKYLTLSNPTFSIINRLVAQLFSSITASIRFENVLNCDISVLQTNLVPYPRIHFPLANFAPILSPEKLEHEELSVMEMTRYVFERENQMMKVDHSFGRFMCCSLLYRGNISPYHVYQALTEIKRDKSIEFVDWCPTGFKVGINVCPPTSVPGSQMAQTTKNVTMLTNTSAIGQAWQRLTHKFYLLYSKRSFVHWFVGEGMEECEFTESLYNISALVKDYEESAMDTKYDEEEGVVETPTPSQIVKNGSINIDNASAQGFENTMIKETNLEYPIKEVSFHENKDDINVQNTKITEQSKSKEMDFKGEIIENDDGYEKEDNMDIKMENELGKEDTITENIDSEEDENVNGNDNYEETEDEEINNGAESPEVNNENNRIFYHSTNTSEQQDYRPFRNKKYYRKQ